jgi:integrase
LVAEVVADYRVNSKRSLAPVLGSIKHLRRCFGLSAARAITTDAVRRYVRQQQDEGAANGSINRELALLKRAFNLAVNDERLSSAPHIPMLAEAVPRQGFLKYGDFISLRSELPEHLQDLASFPYLSGWRRDKGRTLEWRDVELPGAMIRLRPERSKNKRGRDLALAANSWTW